MGIHSDSAMTPAKVLAFCVLSVALLTVVHTDDLKDLSSTDEPELLDTASSIKQAKATDLGEEVEEREKFGFSGMSTSGSFLMTSSSFEEELGEGEDAGEKFGFSGMSTSGSFLMTSSSFEE